MKKVVLACASILSLTAAMTSVAAQQYQKPHQTKNTGISVNTFDELKNALSNNNEETTIILGADITITSGIRINPSKTDVIIDGGGHTLIENSTGVTGTIYIDTNNGTQSVTLKNMSILGKDYYGPVNVGDSVQGVTLNYQDITYRGPQLVHNVQGYANFTGKTNISIENAQTGSNKVQELFEGEGVTINGDFKAVHTGVDDSTFWYGMANNEIPYLTIGDNANVDIEVVNNTLFYVDNSSTKPLDITIGKNAIFNVKTQKSFFRLGNSGNLILKNGSKTNVTQGLTAPGKALLNINGVDAF